MSRRRRPSVALRRRLFQVALLAAFLAAWEVGAVAGVLRPIIFSRPTRVGAAVGRILSQGASWISIGVTLKELGIGLAVGGLSGIAVALVIGRQPFLRRAFDPLILAFYSLPRLALVPLLIVWFGLGSTSKIAVVTIHGFVIMLLAMYSAIDNIDQTLVSHLRSMGAGPVKIARLVSIPSALPQLVVGLRQAIGLAWGSAIVAELIGSFTGIGYQMSLTVAKFNMTDTIAWLIVAAVIALMLDSCVMATSRWALRWR